MFLKIKKWFSIKKKKCNHNTHYYYRKHLDINNTPMIEFICQDCNFRDHGHVYAEPSEWPKMK